MQRGYPLVCPLDLNPALAASQGPFRAFEASNWREIWRPDLKFTRPHKS